MLSLDFWQKTSGTWINVATIVGGTAIGLSLKQNLPKNIQQIITQSLGLFTLFLGTTMASSMLKVKVGHGVGHGDGVILGLLAIVLGGIVGELLQIEQRLQQLGDWLKTKTQSGGRFTEGFVAASLLFCVGPMAIVGGLDNGLTGDNRVLTIKSVMDGLAAIAFGSSYGIGVGFAALPILFYQGSLSLAASLLTQFTPTPGDHPAVWLISGVGGLMVIGIGINLLEIRTIRVGSLLPALLAAPLIYAIAAWLN